MPRTILIANQKGGVGKTTTAMNLGAALARAGTRTGLIDLDPQGALTISCGLDPYAARPSTYDLLLDEGTGLATVLRQVQDNLFLAPANAELVSSEYRLVREKDRIQRLKQAIARSISGMEVLLIDSPPSLGLLTVNALVAAGELLIPVSSDYLSMRGVRALLESVWLVRRRANADLRLLGLVPTFYRGDSPAAEAVVAEMRKVFKHKVTETRIPLDDAASAAPAVRKSVLEYAPGSPSALAYARLAQELFHV